MSFTLESAAGDAMIEFSPTGWTFCLMLSELYGWKPQGTRLVRPGKGPWPGLYDTSDGQVVTRVDAEAMAEALSRALAADDLPERAAEVANVITEALRQAVPDLPPDYSVDATVDEDMKSMFRYSIEFFRFGAFVIN